MPKNTKSCNKIKKILTKQKLLLINTLQNSKIDQTEQQIFAAKYKILVIKHKIPTTCKIALTENKKFKKSKMALAVSKLFPTEQKKRLKIIQIVFSSKNSYRIQKVSIKSKIVLTNKIILTKYENTAHKSNIDLTG